MFIGSFLSWWYTNGWRGVYSSFKPRTASVANAFSVHQLNRTLFAPWKRIITNPGNNINDKFKAALDNLISRSIGFIVRLLVLLAAGLSVIAVALATLVELVVWPVLPLLFIVFLILGVS